jgi:hypothetical protein
MAVGAGASAYSTYAQSQAQKAAYNRQAKVAQRNAEYARLQAQDTRERGEDRAQEYLREADRLEGTQRAQFAASGVKLDSGTPLEIQSNTELLAEQDADIIRANAERVAYGQEMQAFNQQARGDLLDFRAANEDPLLAGTSTLLSGAGSVAGQWYQQKRTRRSI